MRGKHKGQTATDVVAAAAEEKQQHKRSRKQLRRITECMLECLFKHVHVCFTVCTA